MFIVAVYALAKNWKQHNCLSTGVWINKLWHNWYNRSLQYEGTNCYNNINESKYNYVE